MFVGAHGNIFGRSLQGRPAVRAYARPTRDAKRGAGVSEKIQKKLRRAKRTRQPVTFLKQIIDRVSRERRLYPGGCPWADRPDPSRPGFGFCPPQPSNGSAALPAAAASSAPFAISRCAGKCLPPAAAHRLVAAERGSSAPARKSAAAHCWVAACGTVAPVLRKICAGRSARTAARFCPRANFVKSGSGFLFTSAAAPFSAVLAF